MKREIHPEYRMIQAICSCGNIIEFYSTLKENITLDVCYVCHPFYTGQQRTVDSRGRVHRFNKRFSLFSGNNKKI